MRHWTGWFGLGCRAEGLPRQMRVTHIIVQKFNEI